MELIVDFCRVPAPPAFLPLQRPFPSFSSSFSPSPSLVSPPHPLPLHLTPSPPPNPTFTLLSEGGGPGGGERKPPNPSPGQRCRRSAKPSREAVEETPSSQRRNPLPGLGAAARSKVGAGGGEKGTEHMQESWEWRASAGMPSRSSSELPVARQLQETFPHRRDFTVCLQEAGSGVGTN